MPIPLYGFLEGDVMGLLVLGEEGETILQLAQKLQESTIIRVPRRGSLQLYHNDRIIDPNATIEQSGLKALDRFDVVWSSSK